MTTFAKLVMLDVYLELTKQKSEVPWKDAWILTSRDLPLEAWQFPAMPSLESAPKLERRNKIYFYSGIF